MILTVSDPDVAFAKALAAGAREVVAVQEASRAPHGCIAYAARSRNQPAISSGDTSCKPEPNAA
jgi:hypothetical protein